MQLKDSAEVDWAALGLDPAQLQKIQLVHAKHGHRLYRVAVGDDSLILKWFKDPAQAPEVKSYRLLQALGVPTLPLHGQTDDALLLEDLSTSPTWRLATPADVESGATGAAVARWYQALHAAGRALLAGPDPTPGFLRREVDVLNPETIQRTAAKLGLAGAPAWKLAAAHIEALKGALRALPETLNYNDFYWTNLALSRRDRPARRAIVFDYHLLGIGLRYSDCRNVAGSLGQRARAAFWEVYGPVDEREKRLDEPTATLYGLVVAARRPQFPPWAESCVHAVKSGALEKSLRRALEIVQA